ncbi:hypothetical protein ANCCEY_04110 [Ancylostoma ceylanicum]|uniref:Uncharacterized protein n=1 Tax=Ancylostoma ceylanicum TaxID=53326 RepID=A0A0D6M051_9BILA|nr:hypothetical protein ANCCEY_04110 [Ancylostoma ceylanicum]
MADLFNKHIKKATSRTKEKELGAPPFLYHFKSSAFLFFEAIAYQELFDRMTVHYRTIVLLP